MAEPDSLRRRTGPILLGLVLVTLVTRGFIIYKGGIWADEGFVLNVVSISSWQEMLEFLRWHESHPPLFYILTRAWSQLFGGDSATLLTLPVFLSALIVPAIYMAGKAMFDRTTALVAAALASVSPSLAEHSAQLRPYGLLPVLVTVAASSLILGLEGGRRRQWVLFAVSMAALLYTHHWTWLVGAGLLVAAVVFVRRLPPERRSLAVHETLLAAFAVAVLYVPWSAALLYQVRETGHVALPIDGIWEFVQFAVFGGLTVPYMLAFGSVPDAQLTLVLFSIAATVPIILAFKALGKPRGLFAIAPQRDVYRDGKPHRLFLLTVTGVAVLLGIILSPRSNMLLDRCVAMLSPLVILVVASWLTESHAKAPNAAIRGVVVAAGVFVGWLGVANVFAISRTVRSNASAVASEIVKAKRDSDLLIVAPEWFAPSFNHYFPASLEQIDYPQQERSEAVRFDGVRARHADTVTLRRLKNRIADAKASGRRVWLVTSRRYLRFVDERLPQLNEAQRSRLPSVVQIGQTRDELTARFGAADTTHFVRTARSRYDELLPLLFVPDSAER